MSARVKLPVKSEGSYKFSVGLAAAAMIFAVVAAIDSWGFLICAINV
jgi:hypothetical protein